MKAPDKIYIETNAGEAFSSKWTTVPLKDFENTEYIRKNALIEMLKGYSHSLTRLVVQELIDKINEI